MQTETVQQRVGVVLGWLLGAIIATGVGLGAVLLLSQGLTSGESTPLSREAVSSALADATANPSAQTPTPGSSASPTAPPEPTSSRPPSTRTPTAAPVTRSVSSRGGSAIARCSGTAAYLVSWTPAQGWEVEDHLRGPADSVLVIFDGDDDVVDDLTVTITVTCQAGAPVAAIVTSDD